MAARIQQSAPRRGLLSEMARHRTDYLWVAPALLVMLLVIGFPFVYTIDLSFYDTPPSSANLSALLAVNTGAAFKLSSS